MLKKAFNATNRMCFLYHEKAELEELGKTYFQCSRIFLIWDHLYLQYCYSIFKNINKNVKLKLCASTTSKELMNVMDCNQFVPRMKNI